MFSAYVIANDATEPRLGLAISKKACRLAVSRNRIKRQIREYFRQHKQQLAGHDYVILARPLAAKKTKRQLRDDIAHMFEKLLITAAKLDARR